PYCVGEAARLHRIEAGGVDQPFDRVGGDVVVGRVEQRDPLRLAVCGACERVGAERAERLHVVRARREERSHYRARRLILGSVRPICPFTAKPIGFDGSMTTWFSSRRAFAGTSSLIWSSQSASTTTSAPAIASSTEAALALGPSAFASAAAWASSAAASTTSSSPATRCRARALPRLPTPMIA